MASYPFRLLNVFAESTFGGNPLCVFEHAQGMDDATMQALAMQFNLSETTFLLPSQHASARVRVFTTGYEMRFAGHPTLGSAYVVRTLLGCGDSLTLEFEAGIVPVTAQDNIWTFTAPHTGAPRTAPSGLANAHVAALLGLAEEDLLAPPLWVDTGADQLLVPLRSLDAVRRTNPDSTRIAEWPVSSLGRKTAYVFAFDPEHSGQVLARYFFTKHGTGIVEDPGTGSACANLGGWLHATGHTLPTRCEISQGQAVSRPNRLLLHVSANGGIQVGGRVLEIGRGTITL